MGKVTNSELYAESSTSVDHFSHSHPLKLLKFKPLETLNLPSCSACKLQPSESVYACLTCNYYLHQTCSQMPENITHHSHRHQLKLTFSPPYYNHGFSCDICKKTGLNHWLYRCDLCEFDAHLTCVVEVLGASPQASVETQNAAAPSLLASELFMNNYNSVNTNLAAMGTSRQDNQIIPMFQQSSNRISSYNTILQGLISGGAGLNALPLNDGVGGAGSLLQGVTGGGGGVNLQALMGGGGVNLQALMGGGFNLPTLMGGGGPGGGTGSLLQGIMGGGGGALMGGTGDGGVNVLDLMGATGGEGTAELLRSLIGGGGVGGGIFQDFLGGMGGY